MPKMKTKKAASKRFKVRSGGSIKRAHATKRHILTHRTTKNKRHRNAHHPRVRQQVDPSYVALRVKKGRENNASS